jgi:hypothetical protein
MKVLYSIQHLLLLATKRKGILPKVSMCPLDMLSQILYDKTQDVGKTSLLLIKDNIGYC